MSEAVVIVDSIRTSQRRFEFPEQLVNTFGSPDD